MEDKGFLDSFLGESRVCCPKCNKYFMADDKERIKGFAKNVIGKGAVNVAFQGIGGGGGLLIQTLVGRDLHLVGMGMRWGKEMAVGAGCGAKDRTNLECPFCHHKW